MHVDDNELVKFIIDSGLVAKKDLEFAKALSLEKNSSLGKMLVIKGLINNDDLRRAESYILGIPFVDLKNEKMDLSVLSLIPEPIARNHNIVAFKKNADSLEVAMLHLDSLKPLDFLKKELGLKIRPRFTTVQSMQEALLAYQKMLKEQFGNVIQKEASLIKSASDEHATQLVEAIINHALVQSALDIHFVPQEQNLLVKYRIKGILHDAMFLPKTVLSGILYKIRAWDGKFRTEDRGGERISFRTSIVPVIHGEKIIIRVMRGSAQGFILENQGFSEDSVEQIYKSLHDLEGLILAVGPKGSGKTTALYTMLDIINLPAHDIYTVEDPVEFIIPRINQIPIQSPNLDQNLVLKSVLRHEPDILMVSEIKDGGVLKTLLSKAQSDLVLSSIEAASPEEAVEKLLSMGISPEFLFKTLKLIVFCQYGQDGESMALVPTSDMLQS